jgi:hypothetical protein
MSCRTIKSQKVPLGEPVKSCRGAKDMTGFSDWIWRRMALRGEIDSYRVGKQLFIPIREINRVVLEGFRPRIANGGNDVQV